MSTYPGEMFEQTSLSLVRSISILIIYSLWEGFFNYPSLSPLTVVLLFLSAPKFKLKQPPLCTGISHRQDGQLFAIVKKTLTHNGQAP